MIDNYDLISRKIQKDYAEFSKNHIENDFENIIVRKFYILSDVLQEKINRYNKVLKISKIVIAVLFLIFTVAAVIAGNHYGSKMLWFSFWIVFIFIDVFVFLIADYFKNVVFKRFMRFINNAEVMDFNDNVIEEIDDENNSENL
ncbi:MAG: hypothetical protein K2G22_03705 [Eubacterium sp.]|nr:hypothetical protein [Eubacterium sp.]